MISIPKRLANYLAGEPRESEYVCVNAKNKVHIPPHGSGHERAHWLRHTFATMLYFAGVDILTAKEQLGHADIKTTLAIYTHLDKKHKRKEIDKLDVYLNTQQNPA